MNKYRDFDNYLKEYPSQDGYFGKYGGNYLEDPELIKAFNEYAEGYNTIAQSAQFIAELRRIRRDFQGRPTPVYHCQNLSNLLGRTQIYLKREDLNHTGAHKLNHCMGEGLLAKYMGKKKLIAETGAGQHGVALATAAAYFGLECDIYMGEVDIAKQAPNVTRMKILGANVIPVSFGLKTLKEAVDAAFMAYSREYKDAIYCIGTAAGPHPFPLMVRDFQYCIGQEARELFKLAEQKGVVLMEANKTAHSPAFNHLITMIKSGVIGEVVDVNVSESKLWGNKFSRELDAQQAGGSMYEMGSYPLLPIVKLMGTDYQNINFYVKMENGVDLYTKGVMRYPHGICSFQLGIGVKTEGNLVISGTKGYAYVPSPWWLTDYYEFRFEDQNKNKKFFYQWDGAGLRYEIQEFMSCIYNHRFSTARLRRRESIAMADIMQQFRERINFMEI